MNVTYEKKDAMTFIGYHTEIRPEEGYQKCPEFWDKEYAAKYARLWQTMKPENADRRPVQGRRSSGRTGVIFFPGKRVGCFYNQRAYACFPSDTEYGSLAGVVPE